MSTIIQAQAVDLINIINFLLEKKKKCAILYVLSDILNMLQHWIIKL